VPAKLAADEVILSAARVIRFDPRKLVDENGSWRSRTPQRRRTFERAPCHSASMRRIDAVRWL
jgi:hypothetical protein